MKRVLVLGAGLVSRPLVSYLARWPDVALTVGDLDGAKAAKVLLGVERGRAIVMAPNDDADLFAKVGDADIVVSLLPYPLHPKVAKAAIAHRVPLITTSYVSAEMAALDGPAREAGVLLLNEIGLAPGLDHMSAMRVIGRLRREGSTLTSFRSCCGGLPAPESNTNPWGYKFSWSPRGVLAAGRNAARFIDGGRIVEVPAERLFTHVARYVVPEVGVLEVYPNRDSVLYAATYGLDGIGTMFRGTLRYPGWCETLDAVSRLGLLDDDPRASLGATTCAELMEALAAPGPAPLPERVASRLAVAADGAVMDRLKWVGMFSDRPLPVVPASPIDALCARMTESMSYAEGERDMIVLRHEFGFVEVGGRPERLVATLVAFGDSGGDSAMARTVSLPAAVAARLVLDGRIAATGVRIPVDAEIFDPVLDALEPLGIAFRESRTAP